MPSDNSGSWAPYALSGAAFAIAFAAVICNRDRDGRASRCLQCVSQWCHGCCEQLAAPPSTPSVKRKYVSVAADLEAGAAQVLTQDNLDLTGVWAIEGTTNDGLPRECYAETLVLRHRPGDTVCAGQVIKVIEPGQKGLGAGVRLPHPQPYACMARPAGGGERLRSPRAPRTTENFCECDFDCGFRGSYQAVVQHERECPARRTGRGAMPSPPGLELPAPSELVTAVTGRVRTPSMPAVYS